VESCRGRHGLFIAAESGRQRWYEFNILASAQEGRQWDEVLLEDEAEAVSSSWPHKNEAQHDVKAWQRRPKERCVTPHVSKQQGLVITCL
jgi:hypothetical protein